MALTKRAIDAFRFDKSNPLAAVALGLGTHIKNAAVMDDPAARAAIGDAERDRVIATLNVGEPAGVAEAKPGGVLPTLPRECHE